MATEETRQELVEHLSELRVRLINCLLIILAGTAICWGFSEKIFALIRAPIAPYLTGGGLIYTAPMDKFMAHVKVSIWSGVLLTCPIWLWQIWKFVSPGLYSRERKYAVGFIFFGTGLFLIGVNFAYFVVFPMAFKFLMTFGGAEDRPMIAIDQYLSFVTTTTAAFGAAFELPLILVILGMLGLISQRALKDKRRYAILALAVVSAILTPPDLMSMVMMLVPMVGLYELSVLLVGFFERRKVAAMGEV